MKTKLLVLGFVVLCLIAAPTRADMQVHLDIDQTILSYTPIIPGGGGPIVSGTGSVTLMSDAWLSADIYVNSVKMDNTGINNQFDLSPGDGVDETFNAGMTLAFAQLGVNNWSATGTLFVTDKLANSVSANFASTAMYFDSQGGINIDGVIISNSGPSILLGSGSQWTFQGETESISPVTGSDSTANQITVGSNWPSFSQGTVMTMHFGGVPSGSTLDSLFTTSSPVGGYIDGDIDITIVPIPAAVLLGILGLSVAGIKLRKYA